MGGNDLPEEKFRTNQLILTVVIHIGYVIPIYCGQADINIAAIELFEIKSTAEGNGLHWN